MKILREGTDRDCGKGLRGSILQINISRGGVPKRPISQGNVTPLGLAGDSHAHPEIHGGPQKALLILCAEAIDALVAEGFPLFYGALGENLTIRGLDRRQLRVGQRFRAGEVFLELTKVRTPCAALNVYGTAIGDAIYDEAVKAGNPVSPRWGMSGFYASIVRPGVVRQNDIIALVDQAV
ncbi:MAG TPA: MOSC domain-containing protein [Bryobacteraceae bacterium]|nr:MOSC domain-containing protein [Bryobacteraceae bacterium]